MAQWHIGFGILMLFGLFAAEMLIWGACRLTGRPYWNDDPPEPTTLSFPANKPSAARRTA